MEAHGVLRILRILLLHGFLAALLADRSVAIPRPSIEETEEFGRHERSADIPFTLEETYDRTFRSHGFNGTWKSDNEILYTDKSTGNIVALDLNTGHARIVLEAEVTSSYTHPSVALSYDESYALIAYDITAGFRHSTYKKFVVYDTKHKTYEKIASETHILTATWSPTKNALVYVLDNDIYYKDFDTDEHRRITDSGVFGIVYNGVPDWVYEEEVLSAATALWFSPDGRHLAFATFNDTDVKDATFLYYGEPGSLEDQYSTEVKIKYPKAGTPNPIVHLSVVDLTDPSSEIVDLPAPVNVVSSDHILYNVNWWNSRVVAAWTNRVQNRAQWVLYDTQGQATNIFFEEETDGWVRVKPAVFHGPYVILQKLQESGTEAGRYVHVTRFTYGKGKLVDEKDLTPGASEVQSIVAFDRHRERLYYLAAAVGQPSQRNLYFVNLNGQNPPVCVSCSVKTPEGNNCTYASASFSTDRSFFALTCSGPDPPTVSIYDANRRLLHLWEDNQSLRKKLVGRAKPIVKDLYVHVNGYDNKVRLLLPQDFDERKSYPLLINVYAGPNTVRITDASSYGLHSYMTTNRSVIYGWIDGRGSAYKGSKLLFEIYRRMGTVEVEDQIAATHALQLTYPWIDANRTAIWGWSYGGFATAMALSIDKNSVFKCGISVAPVTSWIYYDSIYTERLMGLPTAEDNLAGYNMTDVTRKVEGMRGKKFMLVHGTGDDNVHFQQAMALTKALVDKDILFEQLSYTDEAHGLSGVSPHLYHSMDKFWDSCFGPSPSH